MFASRGFFGAGVVRPNLRPREVNDTNTGADDAEAYVYFLTDGTLQVNALIQFNLSDEWMTGAITAAEAGTFELIVTKNSGNFQYGAAGTFNLGTARKFGCYVEANEGTRSCNATFQIRKVGTTEILASATIDFEAYSSNA